MGRHAFCHAPKSNNRSATAEKGGGGTTAAAAGYGTTGSHGAVGWMDHCRAGRGEQVKISVTTSQNRDESKPGECERDIALHNGQYSTTGSSLTQKGHQPASQTPKRSNRAVCQ